MRCSLLLLLLLAACGHPGTCSRHSDCASGEKCSVAGVCTGTIDAGVADDAAPDAELDGGSP
jgi:hypothetical protein